MKRSDFVDAGKLGGKIAARNMTKQQRIDRAKKANQARRAKAKKQGGAA